MRLAVQCQKMRIRWYRIHSPGSCRNHQSNGTPHRRLLPVQYRVIDTSLPTASKQSTLSQSQLNNKLSHSHESSFSHDVV